MLKPPTRPSNTQTTTLREILLELHKHRFLLWQTRYQSTKKNTHIKIQQTLINHLTYFAVNCTTGTLLISKITTQFESLKITAKCLSFGSKSIICTNPPTIIPSKSTLAKSYKGRTIDAELSELATKTVSGDLKERPYKIGSSVVANMR